MSKPGLYEVPLRAGNGETISMRVVADSEEHARRRGEQKANHAHHQLGAWKAGLAKGPFMGTSCYLEEEEIEGLS